MRALTWQGVNELGVEQVPDARIENEQDVVLEVTRTVGCGSDLHLIGGYIPAMEKGDVIGHEFAGRVVEVGPGVQNHRVGDRVVVCSFISCGRCWHCEQKLTALCENSLPNPATTQALYGNNPGGIYGYSHAMGAFKGSHAEYIRVPYADYDAFAIPDGLSDDAAVFASDSVPTGWMGADLGGVQPGDVVAVWGCGAVGQMAARAAQLLGAERVVMVDRIPERMAMAERTLGVEVLDYTKTDTIAELLERSGGRGPDVCIEAVGSEAHSTGPQYLYDQVKQQLRLQTDRPIAVRDAIYACRTGGSVFVLGVFAGLVDKFPMGAVVNKGLTVRGSQQHGHRYIPMLLDRMAAGEIRTEHFATHKMSLEDAPTGYDIFKSKKDGCIRPAFYPQGVPAGAVDSPAQPDGSTPPRT